MTSDERLSLCGVSSRVGERTLFEGLELTIRRGEVWTVVGPNGAGKSTLLRIAAGLQAPDAGRVELDARPIDEWLHRARARTLAYLPQRTSMVHDLPVGELVMLGRTPHLGAFRGPGPEDRRAVEQALEHVGLRDLARRRMSTLSGGERQRVMLARMLATGAEVLVLDEPTTALDIGHALELLTRLRDLASNGHAVIVALHELELARRFGDRSLCLARDGTYDTGVTSDVLTPDLLERTFGVRVKMGGGMHFEPI